MTELHPRLLWPGVVFVDSTLPQERWWSSLFNHFPYPQADFCKRLKCYRDLIEIALRVKGYGVEGIGVLESFRSPLSDAVLDARVLAEKLERVIGILSRVIDQTRRRVIEGETVPASEKVVSFFECHTDIVEKGNREIAYGHKLFLVGEPPV